eukprot:TRINITY_DN11898_c0_g1_i1.p2 TRINITY_DN11898_c0_g1~~TRINITY_DN11898_c0_g1_i1.p2  ORF type:complete len:100 (-),score=18.75 TRINITY_DN11898_c0_g1_i1:20-319(-)
MGPKEVAAQSVSRSILPASPLKFLNQFSSSSTQILSSSSSSNFCRFFLSITWSNLRRNKRPCRQKEIGPTKNGRKQKMDELKTIGLRSNFSTPPCTGKW